jgi:flavin-dependent dehydrogenase
MIPVHLVKEAHDCDVVICGAGLAGLTLALQLKQTFPTRSIMLIERLSRPLPESSFKVGESSTEAGAYYLSEMLHLSDYFKKTHLSKLGLRFFFGGSTDNFQDRPEFGISEFPVVGSYNIDRGMLENDLRQFADDAGIMILEGCAVQHIELASREENHEVIYKNSDDAYVGKICSRWVIDAMGRRRYLQKKLNLTKEQPQRCSAVWFRLPGRVDVCDLVPRSEKEWHSRVPDNNRYYSTNHLTGTGYWVWLIPLASGTTSVGIVALEAIHPFDQYNTYARACQWLKQHEPLFASYIEDREPLDFKTMRRYSYSSQQVFSSQRWACVGDAGIFSDPLYSPGTDFIALANSFTTEMIRLDFNGKLTPQVVMDYNQTIVALNDTITQTIQLGYPLFGHPVVMAAKVLWDTAAGWSLFAPQIFNAIFMNHDTSTQVRKARAGYFSLTQRMQQLFIDWAKKSSGRCSFQFIDFLKIPFLQELRTRNLRSGKDAEIIVTDQVTNMERLEELAQAIFLVAIEDVMPEYSDQFPTPLWLHAWRVSLHPEKWQTDGLFRPASQPRDLSQMRQQIRSLFHVKEGSPMA